MSKLRRNSAAAPIARYLIPFNASGIKAMMISALKMTADRIADCGVFRCMMFSAFSTGNVAANIAGMIAKYLATSFAIENVVSAPRVISSCLPIATTSQRQQEERYRSHDKDHVLHTTSSKCGLLFRRDQNLTSTDRFNRFSSLRRSGAHPGTVEPRGPVFPPGGVTPPRPVKYGTFAARWLYSQRKVMY